jgi:hypothetical protein
VEINLDVLRLYVIGFAIVSVASIALGLFLINRGDWWEAKRTTDFGLLGVNSEWDLFWIRCKIIVISFAGRLFLALSVPTGVLAIFGYLVYVNTPVVD